jgi:hypothetical protein
MRLPWKPSFLHQLMILCLWYNIASEIEREEGKKSAGEKLPFSFITATSSSSAFQLLFHQK